MFIPSKPFLPIDMTDSRVVFVDCFPRQAIPAVVKLLLRRTYSSSWAEGQHEIGRDMIARCIVSLYSGACSDVSTSIDRVYRLLDGLWFGNVYSVQPQPDGTTEIVPPLPEVPYLETWTPESAKGRLLSLYYAANNMATGIPNDEVPDDRNLRQQLDDIKAAIEAMGGESQEELLAVVQQIALLLA